MSKQVFKYELPANGKINLVMPAGAELLHVGFQGASLMLWAKVDVRQSLTESRRIFVATTGEDLPNTCKRYLGTALVPGGSFVVHVFETE